MGLASSARANSRATNSAFRLREVASTEPTPYGAVWLRCADGHVLDCVRPADVERRSARRYRCSGCLRTG